MTKLSRQYVNMIRHPERVQAANLHHSISAVFIVFCISIAIATGIQGVSVGFYYRAWVGKGIAQILGKIGKLRWMMSSDK